MGLNNINDSNKRFVSFLFGFKHTHTHTSICFYPNCLSHKWIVMQMIIVRSLLMLLFFPPLLFLPLCPAESLVYYSVKKLCWTFFPSPIFSLALSRSNNRLHICYGFPIDNGQAKPISNRIISMRKLYNHVT